MRPTTGLTSLRLRDHVEVPSQQGPQPFGRRASRVAHVDLDVAGYGLQAGSVDGGVEPQQIRSLGVVRPDMQQLRAARLRLREDERARAWDLARSRQERLIDLLARCLSR